MCSLSVAFTQKIKFTGKGYRIKKSARGKGVRLVFGHSHRLDLIIASCRILRLAKQKFLFFSNRAQDVCLDKWAVPRVRSLSPYTKRGLRLFQERVIKRPGKKAAY